MTQVVAGSAGEPADAALRRYWASFGGDDWRIGAVVRTWTIGMLVVSAMVGAALLFSRMTGVWS